MKAKDLHNIPDVQAAHDSRKLAIDQVGVKAIRHPVRIMERPSAERAPATVQHTIASFNMYVGLPHQFKGTHMSRFVEILAAQERELTVESFKAMLKEMVARLEAEEGRIEMAFPVLHREAGAGFRGQEPDGLRSHLHRRDHERQSRSSR